MAGDTKTFQTQFRISAVWAGQPGVQKAQRALGGLQKTAKAATTHFRGMSASVFKGMAAYGLASKAASAFTDVLFKSVTAATEAQEAHDELFTTVERMAKRYKSTAGKSVAEVSAIVEESTQALIKASEVMEETGHDAETLQKGWGKLAATGALDPKQILEQRDAFSDVLSYIAGANATAEESAQLGDQWADAILRGNVALLKQLDLSTGEIELVKNVTKLEKKGAISGEEAIKRRQDLVLKFAKKFEGETIRVFQRPSGKIAQMWTQVSNVFETLGQPFVDRAPEMAASFKKIAVEAEPVARELAKMTGEALKNFAKWLEEGGASTIVKNLGHIVTGLKGIEEWLNKINDAATKHDSIWQWLQKVGKPGAQKKLPGSPSQQPAEAHMGGKAGERYREGTRAKAVLKAGGYAPYGRQAPALNEAYKTEKAAAEAQKAAPPSAAVGSISGNLMAKAKEWEGFYEKAYWDYSQWSIGHGTKAAGPGETITREGAEKALAAELSTHQARVDRAAASVGLKLTPGQRDALTSFDFNTGDAAKLITSSGGDIAEIERRMPSWNKVTEGGRKVVSPGLIARRAKEMAMFRSKGGDAAAAQATAAPPPAKTWRYASQEEEQRTGGKGPNYPKEVQPVPAPAEIIQKAAVPTQPSLRDILKELDPLRRTGTGSPSVTMNAPVTINGVAPGRESLMAKKTALALRDPVAEGLRLMREMQAQDRRTNFA